MIIRKWGVEPNLLNQGSPRSISISTGSGKDDNKLATLLLLLLLLLGCLDSVINQLGF